MKSSAGLSKDLKNVLETMMNPHPDARPSATQLLAHPCLRSRRRWRCLRLGMRNTRQLFHDCIVALLLRLLQFFLLVFWPLRALSRKWRKCDGSHPTTPVVPRPGPCNDSANDLSFSDGKRCLSRSFTASH